MKLAIAGFFWALTAALRVAPLAMVWKVTSEIEELNEEILRHEQANTAHDLLAAKRLRIKRAWRCQLHDALQSAIAAPAEGKANTNHWGNLHSTN